MPIALLTCGWAWMCMFDTMAAGNMRSITDTPSPRMDGPDCFMRAQRAQMNTVEQAIAFLPSLWAHALLCDAKSAAIAGSLYMGARITYSMAYRANNKGLVKFCTLPGYLTIAYLAYGPVHELLLRRRWGMSKWAGIGTLVGFHVGMSALAIGYCSGPLRTVARLEGADASERKQLEQ